VDCTFPPGTEGERNHFDLPEVIALGKDFPNTDIVLMHIGHRLDEWLMNHPEAMTEHLTLGRDNESVDCPEVQ
jgi:phosphoribosyl 1,2-cyclic phosphate phosphodiesterase